MELSKREALALIGLTILAVALGSIAAAVVGPHPDPNKSRYFGYSFWAGTFAAAGFVLSLIYRRAYSSTEPSFNTGSFQGVGTTMYGMREFLPDGSFTTTAWLILAFIPIVPIYSARILSLTRSGLVTSYRIEERMKPVGIQVVSTYTYTALCALALFIFFRLVTEVSVVSAFVFLLPAALLVIGLPTFLRRKGRRAANL